MAGNTGPSQADLDEAKRQADLAAQVRADQQAAANAALQQNQQPVDDQGNTQLAKKKRAQQLATSYNQGTLLQ